MNALRPGGLELTVRALSFCEPDIVTRVLDVGCGRGESLAFIRERYGCNVFGVERNFAFCEQARVQYPEIPIFFADAEVLPFGDASFDLVLAECALSVFDCPESALAEIGRVLAPEGVLLATDVVVRDRSPRVSPGKTGELLSNLYTCEEFAALAERSGFALEIWEDHSGCLAQMFGQIILDQGPEKARELLGLEDRALEVSDIGYALFVLRKEVFP